MPNDVDTPVLTQRVLRLDDVEALVGLSGAQLWKMEQRGAFPRRIPLSARTCGWIESEVQSWIASRMKLRDDAIEAARLRGARMPPGVRHRLRMQREREGEEPTG